MKQLIKIRMKRKAKRELEYLAHLQSITTVYNMATPKSDAAMRQYLVDSIAWLDAGAE